MIRRVLARLVGHWCGTHERGFRSDFCPECLGWRIAKEESSDKRPEWTKAEGSWPIKGNGGEAA